MFRNGERVDRIGNFGDGDRIGMLIDMENKTLNYWKNGNKMMPSPWSLWNVDEVHVLAVLTEGSMSIIEKPEIPEEAQDLITAFANKQLVEEEEKKREETEEEHKEEIPKNFSNILKHSTFDCINEDVGELTPTVASIWILVYLSKMSEDFYIPYNLKDKSARDLETAFVVQKRGLTVDIQAETFNTLYEILSNVVEIYTNKQWDKMDSKLCQWAIIATLKILKGHIFTVKHLSIEESASGLTSEVQGNIHSVLKKLLEIEDDSPNHEPILNQASLILIHGFN